MATLYGGYMVKQTGKIDKVLGSKILSQRIAKGISRKDLADAIGITHQQIQKYETGKNRISASSLFLLSQSLRIPIEDFFIGIAVHFEEKA